MRTILLSVCVALAGCGNSVLAEEEAQGIGDSTSLKIKLLDIRGTEGNVVVAIYDDKQAFESHAEPIAFASVPAKSQEITLTGFPYEQFAIAVFHDTNRNGEFDMKDGRPLEGWGNSGDVSQWSEPTYEDALTSRGLVTVRMQYYY